MKRIITILFLCAAFGAGLLLGLSGREWRARAEEERAAFANGDSISEETTDENGMFTISQGYIIEPSICSSLENAAIGLGRCNDGRVIQIVLGAHGTVYWQEVQP